MLHWKHKNVEAFPATSKRITLILFGIGQRVLALRWIVGAGAVIVGWGTLMLTTGVGKRTLFIMADLTDMFMVHL